MDAVKIDDVLHLQNFGLEGSTRMKPAHWLARPY